MYQPHIVRYSLTTAVTECSEWTPDNTGRSSTCCLYTHTHTHTHSLKNTRIQSCVHVDTHSLYQSQGFCQRMCQHYQSYFSPGQSSRSQIREKGCGVQTCVCVCVCLCVCVRLWAKVSVTCAVGLACSHFFSIFRANLCKCVCVCSFLCVRRFIKEHRSLRQCEGLWQRKQIFVPLPPTGNGSYTHRTPLSYHTLTHTHTDTLRGSVTML